MRERRRRCVRIDASVEDTEHAWTIISWAPVLLEGAAHEAFNVLHKQRIGHLKDESAGTRNMKKAIDVVGALFTPHHRGVVGTLVDENAEDRHKPSGRLDLAKGAINSSGGVDCTQGVEPQARSAPIKPTTG